MKLATYQYEGRSHVGIVGTTAIRPLDALSIGSMLEAMARFGEIRPECLGPTAHNLADVELIAPLPRPPRNVLCVGKNYAEHAEEFGGSGFDTASSPTIPQAPVVFTKPPESVIGHRAPIRLPRQVTDSLDYEAELAVIIGKEGRGIRHEDAHRHVFGYTIVNDITARDLQARHGQWFLGKSLDTSCPMGPWIVTADEIDASALSLRCWVNGELRQDAHTSELIFDIPTLIETISASMTLRPGDVIATGTPAGVGLGFAPPRFLAEGDTIHIEISGIGALTNTVTVD